MKQTLAIILVILFGLIGFLMGGWTGGLAGVFVALLPIALIALMEATVVRVPEWRVAPIFNREAQRFERFLPPGHHVIKPFIEHAGEMINTGSVTARGTCEGALTSGGIPISIHWTVLFSMDPFSIEFPDLRSKMARALPEFAENIVINHANNVLKHIVGKYEIDYFTEGAHQQELEDEFKAAVQDRVAVMGMSVMRVMIVDIQIPQKVRDALEEAHEKMIVAEAEARALRHLHDVIDDFDAEDIDNLERLERIKMLGTEGGSMAYLMSSWLDENTRQMNRREPGASLRPRQTPPIDQQRGD